MGLLLDSDDRAGTQSRNKRVRISENGEYVYPASETYTEGFGAFAEEEEDELYHRPRDINNSGNTNDDLDLINDMLLDPPPWTLQPHRNSFLTRLGIPIYGGGIHRVSSRSEFATPLGSLRRRNAISRRNASNSSSNNTNGSGSARDRRGDEIRRELSVQFGTDLVISGSRPQRDDDDYENNNSNNNNNNNNNDDNNNDNNGEAAREDADEEHWMARGSYSPILPVDQNTSPPRFRERRTFHFEPSPIARTGRRRRYETFGSPRYLNYTYLHSSGGQPATRSREEFHAEETSDEADSDILTDSDPTLDSFALGRTSATATTASVYDDDWHTKETRARFRLMQRDRLCDIDSLKGPDVDNPAIVRRLTEQSIKMFGKPMPSGVIPFRSLL